ncbi:hypothetical protein SAMN05444413_10334 [Roseivivax marinus]|uniref:hypothetical protein n=1 Tax=Roseivivax marinus TaxID=1379903 RepID=UPI0008C5745C|nr:hypothetical protein [Roseivivax marinus]SEK69878.1 hypothetical protein SAMN05444413_10334 [Roseivivax marinus]
MRATQLGCLFLGLGGAFAGAQMGLAQETGGLTGRATLGAGLRHEDGTTTPVGEIGVALSSITRTETLGLSFGTVLARGGGQGDDETDIDAGLSYSRLGPRSGLSFDLGYVRNDVGVLTSEEETLDPDALRFDSGKRTVADAALRYVFGTDMPVGGDVGIETRDVSYSGLPDGALEDFRTRGADATLRFALTPTADLRLSAETSRTESEGDGEDADRSVATVGLDVQVSPSLEATLGLGVSEMRRSAPGVDKEIDRGPEIELGLVRSVRDGTYGLRATHVLTGDGPRTELRATRVRTLPTGALTWELGASHADEFGLDPVLALGYERSTRAATLSVALAREIEADLFGDTFASDSLALGLRRDLTPRADLTAGVAYRDVEPFADGVAEVERLEMSFGVNYALTRDVDLRLSAERTRIRTGGSEADRVTNSVFLGVERGIDWRP